MGADIMSIIFLALICIVIAGIVHRLTPHGLMMPSFALLAVCLWVAYDYIMLKRYQMKESCARNSRIEDEEIERKINILSNEINSIHGAEELPDDDEPVNLEPESKNNNEFDIDMYNDMSIQDMHKHMGCTGDNKIANRMKYMGMQSKLSKDIRSKMNRYTLLPYFEEELNDTEKRTWWDEENDWMDELM